MLLIDTHAHLNFKAFEKDRKEVIRRSLDTKIWMINVGTNYETSKKAVEIAQNHEKGIWAVVGLHPIHIDEHFDYERYKELAKSEKVVAIGEIGLDYAVFVRERRERIQKRASAEAESEGRLQQEVIGKARQKEIFLKQLDLARELNLPVIFHCRMAHAELLKELGIRNYELGIEGVVHCFTGDWEQAKKYLEMGFYLGFNGIIFKSIEGIDFEEIIKKTPLDRILVETDCPFLTPPDFPEERNNPLGVKYVVQRIAEIKNLTFEEVAKKTTQNAQKLFRIP